MPGLILDIADGPCPCCVPDKVPMLTKIPQIRSRLKRGLPFYFTHLDVSYYVTRGGAAYTADETTGKYCHYAGIAKVVLESQPKQQEVGAPALLPRKRKR